MNRKGQWSKYEDMMLLQAVNLSKYNYNYLKPEIQAQHRKYESKSINWENVQVLLQGSRNIAQCRQRYLNYLSPNIRKGKFTLTEDKAIISMFKSLGAKWSRFRENPILEGRTVFDLRTRLRTLLQSNDDLKDKYNVNKIKNSLSLSSISVNKGVLTKDEVKYLEKYLLKEYVEDQVKESTVVNTKECNDICEAVEGILLFQGKEKENMIFPSDLSKINERISFLEERMNT